MKRMSAGEMAAIAAALGLSAAAWLPGARAQEPCFTSADVAGSVLGTFFSTLAVLAVGFLVYWFFCRKRRDKAQVSRPSDEDIERHAYTNPYFQDDEPDKAPLDATENGKPVTDVGSTKPIAVITAENKAPKGNKKAKANSRTNPFSVFTNNKGHPQRALDDSCIHQEPERIEVSLRGSDFTGLGFNICGNIRDGIYVRDVLHRGPAGESGKIKAGDRIMNVTVSFDKITIEDALTILSYASPYDVSLDVQKTSDQPGCFLPGHQKKGSMDSSTSGSLGGGGERLSHPIYRSQSSDDVSQLNRESGSTSKRSLSVGIPARLKKDGVSKPNAPSLQEETITEGSGEDPKTSRFVSGGSLASDADVVVHKEERANVEDVGRAVAVNGVSESRPLDRKVDEVLVKNNASPNLEPLTKLNDEIEGIVNEIFTPSVNDEKEVDNNLKLGLSFTNPFKTADDIFVADVFGNNNMPLQTDSRNSESGSQNIDPPSNVVESHVAPDYAKVTSIESSLPSFFNDNGSPNAEIKGTKNNVDAFQPNVIHSNAQPISSMLDNFMNNVKESIATEAQHLNATYAQDGISENPDKNSNKGSNSNFITSGSEVINQTVSAFGADVSDKLSNKVAEVNRKISEIPSSISDGLNDSMSDFEINIPSVDLKDLQERFLNTMRDDEVPKSDKQVIITLPTEGHKVFDTIETNKPQINMNISPAAGEIELNACKPIINPSHNAGGTVLLTEDVPAGAINMGDQNMMYNNRGKALLNGESSGGVDNDDDIDPDSLEVKTEKKFAVTTSNLSQMPDGMRYTSSVITPSSTTTTILQNKILDNGANSNIVQIPRVDLRFPSSAEFDVLSDNRLSATVGKCSLNFSVASTDPKISEKENGAVANAASAQPTLDPDLHDNIQYFESKMQTALQKSPKLKSKRSSIPGKRKAPLPPIKQQFQAEENDNSHAGNPFVVGLKPMGGLVTGTEHPVANCETIVLTKSNNVTTVKVNVEAPNVSRPDDNPETNHADAFIKTAAVIEEIKPPRKLSNKTDANCNFGFFKTNFFEGLDKAGNDDQHLMAKKGDVDRFNSIPRSGVSLLQKGQGAKDDPSGRRSSSLGDLSKIEESIGKPFLSERAVSMDLNEANDVPVGHLGDLKMQMDDSTLSQKDSSDETLLSHADTELSGANRNTKTCHPIEYVVDANGLSVSSKDNPVVEHSIHQDLESWIQEKVNDKENYKSDSIQGLLKKEKGPKRKKKEELNNDVVEIAPIVPSTTVVSTATINIGNDNKSISNAIPSKNLGMNAAIPDEGKSISFANSIDSTGIMIASTGMLNRRDSISSSSLSDDSIDKERDTNNPPKRRMIAVDVTAVDNYMYDSDSEEEIKEANYVTAMSSTNTNNVTFFHGHFNNDNHDDGHPPGAVKDGVHIPIIPPIISPKDVRPHSYSANDDTEQHEHHIFMEQKRDDELNRPIGQVRCISPTKFPRMWSSTVVDERVHNREKNGDIKSEDHHESNSDGVNSLHYTLNYQPSQPGSQTSASEQRSITTMHVTVSNNAVQQSKNTIGGSDVYTAFPVNSQGAISKTVIISTPQFSLPVESTETSGPESPPPILQPPQ